ncbi:hypothetical protein BDD12DRAFT_807043 [Trichophaea hybrida]|nr:hypothetical protein BDD12DRAFT_807043 [Trichophaea hybrida]
MESSQESSMNTRTQLASARATQRRIDAFNKPRRPLLGPPPQLRPAQQAQSEPTRAKEPTTEDNRRERTERSLSPHRVRKAPQTQRQPSGKIPTKQKGSPSAPISIAPITGLWRDQPFFKKRLEKAIQQSPDQTTTPKAPSQETPSGSGKTARSPIVHATTTTEGVMRIALPRLWMNLGSVPKTLPSLTRSISPPKTLPGGTNCIGQGRKRETSNDGELTTVEEYGRTEKSTKYYPETVEDWISLADQEQEFRMVLSDGTGRRRKKSKIYGGRFLLEGEIFLRILLGDIMFLSWLIECGKYLFECLENVTTAKVLFFSLLFIPKAQAIPDYDWTEFNRIMSAIEEPDSWGWATLLAATVTGAVIAAQILRRLVQLVRQNPNHNITPDEWRRIQAVMEQSAERFFEAENLLKDLRKHILELEEEANNDPTKEKVQEYIKAVADLAVAEEEIRKLREENPGLKDTMAAMPSGSSTSEQVKNFSDTITNLQSELQKTKIKLSEALQLGTGRPEGTTSGLSKSIVPDPPKYDGKKMENFVPLERALRGKIRADPEQVHRSLDTTWEYLCSRLSDKPLLHMRMKDKEDFYKAEESLDTPMDEHSKGENMVEGFIQEIRRHYSNHTERLEIMQKYHNCKQGNRDFQTFYQEISMYALRLSLSIDTEEFRIHLTNNMADYLKKLVIGKRWEKLDDAVNDLRYTDAQYRLFGGSTRMTEQVTPQAQEIEKIQAFRKMTRKPWKEWAAEKECKYKEGCKDLAAGRCPFKH